MNQALILAAGRGSRLSAASSGRPKCLVEVDGATLLERQLAVLEALGMDRIGIVVGYCAEAIREHLGDRCEYLLNPHFADTNSLYSLWIARTWVEGALTVLNADVLAHPEIYQRLLGAGGSAIAVDRRSGNEAEQMKVALRHDLVWSLSKTLPAAQVDGENVGILHFTAVDAPVLLEEADRIVRAGGLCEWAPAAVERTARRTPVRAVDVSDLPWTEIDFPEDLQSARMRRWPHPDLLIGVR